MKKIDVILFMVVGIIVGALTTHILWKEHFREEVNKAVERVIMFNLKTDGKGNIYWTNGE